MIHSFVVVYFQLRFLGYISYPLYSILELGFVHFIGKRVVITYNYRVHERVTSAEITHI